VLVNGTTISYVPVTVSGISKAVAVSAGDYHTCARLGTGSVQCWGRNDYGMLGDGTPADRLVPVTVVGF